ncbi:MAG: hypothetical protein PSV36_12390 [Algoriphagus sp.]|nr:hypothetical protein [Algoriphagus sp.]
MKKSYLVTKIVFGLTAGFLVTSCISEPESPVLTEQLEKSVALSEGTTGEENLRKYPEFNYFEKFSNQITPKNEGQSEFGPIVFLPGTGVGNATFLGKSYSFINQLAVGPTTTISAPVTQYYLEDLEALGLTGIPDNVNSLTTDGKGNAIFFESDVNTGSIISETRTEFSAELEVVGGTGKFLGVTGTGMVEGFYNPKNGVGASTVRANIKY